MRRLRLAAPLALIIAVALTGCDAGAGASSTPSDGPTVAVPTDTPSAAPDESADVPAESSAPASPPSQSDTAWGRIWDAVPEDFPRYPGGVVADDATAEVVSDAYLVPVPDAAIIADWMQTNLEMATYSTEGLSGPLEDGSFVIDSVGDGDCRLQTTITPLDEMTLVTVRYGADCPS
jgi:hypothetical protein